LLQKIGKKKTLENDRNGQNHNLPENVIPVRLFVPPLPTSESVNFTRLLQDTSFRSQLLHDALFGQGDI
jgi:hypothetical protein